MCNKLSELAIFSFLVAYPLETVRFEWFTRKHDAIDKNPDVKLPELYIDRYEPTVCGRNRKSGDLWIGVVWKKNAPVL